MKRKVCMIIALLTIIITAFNVGFFVKDEFFYNMNNLPNGKLLRRDYDQNILFSSGILLEIFEVEPTDEYPAAIRVAVKNDNTGESRTIYWQIGTRESIVTWPEGKSTTVIINGVPIDYVNGYYDCRDYANFTYVPKTDNDGNL